MCAGVCYQGKSSHTFQNKKFQKGHFKTIRMDFWGPLLAIEEVLNNGLSHWRLFRRLGIIESPLYYHALEECHEIKPFTNFSVI